MALNVPLDEVRAAADRWRMIVNDLGEGGAPPGGLATTWPSAAATDAIHAGTVGATEAFQARISDTAAASDAAANTYHNREMLGAGDIGDLISAVTSPVEDVAGIVTGSMVAVNGVAIGTISQLSDAATSGTSNLINALAGPLGQVDNPRQVPLTPVLIDQLPEGFETPIPTDQPPEGFERAEE
jgi:hypothetical protein